MMLKSNKICGVYKIISPSKKKIYIGQSIDINKRWKSYKVLSKSNKRQQKLHNSFLKYGVENHVFEIIEECSLEDLNCRERYWQDFYDVLNEGLNYSLVNCDDKKYVHSQETKNKISEAQKGSKNHMFGKTGKLNPFYGKKHSKETIEKFKNKKTYRRN